MPPFLPLLQPVPLVLQGVQKFQCTGGTHFMCSDCAERQCLSLVLGGSAAAGSSAQSTPTGTAEGGEPAGAGGGATTLAMISAKALALEQWWSRSATAAADLADRRIPVERERIAAELRERLRAAEHQITDSGPQAWDQTAFDAALASSLRLLERWHVGKLREADSARQFAGALMSWWASMPTARTADAAGWRAWFTALLRLDTDDTSRLRSVS